MAEWLTPVTDRKATDCVYGNPKGCISAEFLNRIETNVTFIVDYFESLHIAHSAVDAEIDKWSRMLYLKISEFNRIQQNIINLRTAGIIRPSTPTIVKSNAEEIPTYVLLNSMEQILFDIKLLLDSVAYSERKLGTFTLGNNKLLQLIRRR